MKHLKLVPHPIPTSLHGYSAYQVLDRPSEKTLTIGNQEFRVNRRLAGVRSKWESIRQDIISKAGDKCSICGTPEGTLQCHEEWEYDSESERAILSALLCVCKACHSAISIGGISDPDERKQALEHMARVNGTTIAEAQALESKIYGQKWQLDMIKWHVTIAPELLKQYPELSRLQR